MSTDHDVDTSAGGPAEVGEIQRADPRTRSLVLAALLILALLGTWAVVDLRNQVDAAQRLSYQSPRVSAEAMVAAADGFFRTLALWTATLGTYLCWSGWRIHRAGRYPPPGAFLIRDTRVRGGAASRVRSGLALAVGLLSLAAAAVMPAVGGNRIREVLAIPLATPDEEPRLIDPDVFPGSGAPGAPPTPAGGSAEPESP